MSGLNVRVLLTGLAMGAADIVPGVSGGTVAFLSGYYDRLISALSAMGPGLYRTWRSDGFQAAWRAMDGSFLVTLGSGILISILTLAQLISWLLINWPQLVWGFFFGLVLAGVYTLMKPLALTPARWGIFMLGAVLGLAASSGFPAQLAPSALNIFLGGALAICAMILPGISGSFILLLLGLYLPVIEAVKALNLPVMAIFAAGCLTGLICFSRVLHWLLIRFHDNAVCLLAGIMGGALYKLWPWKHTIEYQFREGHPPYPLVQVNVWPDTYTHIAGQPAMLTATLLLAFLGGGLVIRLAKVRTTSHK